MCLSTTEQAYTADRFHYLFQKWKLQAVVCPRQVSSGSGLLSQTSIWSPREVQTGLTQHLQGGSGFWDALASVGCLYLLALEGSFHKCNGSESRFVQVARCRTIHVDGQSFV